ncbi:hypothetical protein Srufu_008730 [Streptomyces libani subsp. rufus]|nr:hypothetical protein Srufu_008730 [Streptomyces libani subsp. rufus]
MDSTVNAWKNAMHREGVAMAPSHPAGVVDLTADLSEEGDVTGAKTLSTQPFFDCCG